MRLNMKRTIATPLLFLLPGMLLGGCITGPGAIILRKEAAKEFNIEDAIDKITHIDINTSIAKVELIPSDHYSVEIDYLYWDEEPDYSLTDGKLHFDDGDSIPNSYSINFKLDNTIKVYLPDNADLSNLSIKNSSGNVELSGFVAGDMKVTVSYGDLTIRKAASNNAKIKLSSGNSTIDDFEVGNLKFTNSYGDSDFDNINTGSTMLLKDIAYDKIDISMSSGKAELGGIICSNLQLNNSYGDVICEEIKADKLDAGLSSGNLTVNKSDIKDIDAKNSYGDVNLSLIGPKADYSLNLDTSYGSIQVGNKKYKEHMDVDRAGTRSIYADLSSGNVKISFFNN